MCQLGIIIFARFDSVRLPGKAMLDLGGIPMLARIIRRAQLTGYPVFLATSDEPNDDVLVELAHEEQIGVFAAVNKMCCVEQPMPLRILG